MSAGRLVVARETEAEAIWPVVKGAHLFRDLDSYRAFRHTAPWRVLSDGRDSAAVVERWRPHLDILAIKGLWAPGRLVPVAVDSIRAVARSRQLPRILSPVMDEGTARLYAGAGLEETARLVALRASRSELGSTPQRLVPGVALRPAGESDLDELAALDAECFEPFWAYGHVRLADAVEHERVLLACLDGELIGYTLSTVERGSGTLGRIGVAAPMRGKGVGTMLLTEALRYMLRSGALTISLCTQEENVASRALYAGVGFREVPGRLLMLVGDA